MQTGNCANDALTESLTRLVAVGFGEEAAVKYRLRPGLRGTPRVLAVGANTRYAAENKAGYL